MWNFVGRQNDRAGTYDILNGNWISGISLLILLDWESNQLNQDELDNKARNVFSYH